MATAIPEPTKAGKIEVAGWIKSLFGLVPIFKVTKEVKQKYIYHDDKFEPTVRDI